MLVTWALFAEYSCVMCNHFPHWRYTIHNDSNRSWVAELPPFSPLFWPCPSFDLVLLLTLSLLWPYFCPLFWPCPSFQLPFDLVPLFTLLLLPLLTLSLFSPYFWHCPSFHLTFAPSFDLVPLFTLLLTLSLFSPYFCPLFWLCPSFDLVPLFTLLLPPLEIWMFGNTCNSYLIISVLYIITIITGYFYCTNIGMYTGLLFNIIP